VNEEIYAVRHRVGARFQDFIFANNSTIIDGSHRDKFNFAAVVERTIKERKDFLAQWPIATSLEGLEKTTVQATYSDRIRAEVVKQFSGLKLPASELDGLVDLAIESLIRAFPSDLAAGVVVAGYGEDETFPSLYSTEVDGRVAGKLKILERKSSKITSAADGQVTHFAQTDVIERLLNGVDDRFASNTAEFIDKAVTQVAETIEKATRRKRISKKKIEERMSLIREVVDTVVEEYQTKTVKTLKSGFSREFDRMIAMMPKQEIIELAEALVSITAVERKATSDEGTVGGPIDVAFLTKHEGFVWIKRKHYFNRDLNPRYFWRKYGESPHRSVS
jgi:hypothetical protein